MPPPRISQGLLAQFSQMSLSASRPTLLQQTCLSKCRFTVPTTKPSVRLFSSTPSNLSYLAPKGGESRKSRKGRCRVPTGGSMRGTTVVWGDYGLRMRDHDRRISAHQLRIAEETIRKRLRGMKFRLYMRIAANIGVYTSGNDVRMGGKGKGSFDRWTARVAVVKDAFRLAGNKLPGLYEFVKKGDPPVMGLTKVGVNGITEEDLKRPRRKEPLEQTAARLPSA
ncbi:50S ribosomal protein L16 [Pyrenophora tritici-repentis]|nr:50S ribosomal protein L16 [Pyrenophora tritici-repentis]